MHIRDGFLSPEVCLGTGVLALGAMGWSLHKLRHSLGDRTVPLTGMTASLIFASQMVNFPLPLLPVSGHLLGGVLAAVLLGPWAGCVAISLVLMIQLALFYDGGWTVLGANILNMGVVGAWGGYVVYAALRSLLGNTRKGTLIAACLAAWLSVLAASTVFCAEFWLSWSSSEFNFLSVFGSMVFLHCLIGIGEAIITVAVLNFVLIQRPDLIYQSTVTSTSFGRIGRFFGAGLVTALATAAFLTPFASEYADGLEEVAGQTGFDKLGREMHVLLWSDYQIPALEQWGGLSTSAAGILGTSVVLVVACGVMWLLKWTTKRSGRIGN
ncbi:MAG: ABC-type Co2+ transport system, permease component [Planctomycetaceae bacterium]|nr:ABC-type Co2+ transport system, permease component [Planctomycetaceae bacterium]